jgi:hypothetical protein
MYLRTTDSMLFLRGASGGTLGSLATTSLQSLVVELLFCPQRSPGGLGGGVIMAKGQILESKGGSL